MSVRGQISGLSFFTTLMTGGADGAKARGNCQTYRLNAIDENAFDMGT
jgi:hypothetical protein